MNNKVYLKDAQGQVLQMQNLTRPQHEFDVEMLKNGIYFVEMQFAHGKPVVYQFYINHSHITLFINLSSCRK
jgi:hypothetical protein